MEFVSAAKVHCAASKKATAAAINRWILMEGFMIKSLSHKVGEVMAVKKCRGDKSACMALFAGNGGNVVQLKAVPEFGDVLI